MNMKHSQKSASCMVLHWQGSHPWYHCKSCHRQCRWRHKGSQQIQKTWFVLKWGFVCRLHQQLVWRKEQKKTTSKINHQSCDITIVQNIYFGHYYHQITADAFDSSIIMKTISKNKSSTTISDIPDGFTTRIGPNGQHYLVPQYMVPALDQAFASYRKKAELHVVTLSLFQRWGYPILHLSPLY